MRRTKGFTLVELLVVVAIIALLVSILLPTLGRAKELAKQALCGANLNGIGKGYVIYMAENDDIAPWIDGFSDTLSATGTNANNTSTPSAVSPTALMFLVVRTGQPVDLFRCPSDDNATKMAATRFTVSGSSYYFWDFCDSDSLDPGGRDCKRVSYSIQAPVSDGSGNYSSGFTASSRGGLAIMADKTPIFDGKTLKSWATDPLPEADRTDSMSQNHNSGDFINVLYSDAHVSGENRADVGIGNDNIYSASGSTTEGSQTATGTTLSSHRCEDDSFLVGPVK